MSGLFTRTVYLVLAHDVLYLRNFSGLNYQWLVNGTFIFTRFKPYIFISRNGKLYFSTITKEDVGFYRCYVTVPQTEYSFQGGRSGQEIEVKLKGSRKLNVLVSLPTKKKTPRLFTKFYHSLFVVFLLNAASDAKKIEI